MDGHGNSRRPNTDRTLQLEWNRDPNQDQNPTQKYQSGCRAETETGTETRGNIAWLMVR